jgi:hypothetical protein
LALLPDQDICLADSAEDRPDTFCVAVPDHEQLERDVVNMEILAPASQE